MIIGNIADTTEIEKLNPSFKKAFSWIRENIANANSLLSQKRVYIDEDNLFVNIDNPTLRTKEEQLLEIHCNYIDIHIPISATEVIGWKHRDTLMPATTPYDKEKDYAMYKETPHAYYTLKPGDYCIMYTTDAHAPIIGVGQLIKFCVKIKV